jgi:hypothetical protein
MDNVFQSFAISLFASLVAIIVTLYIERKRLPHIELLAGERYNADNTYSDPQRAHIGRAKFYRLQAINKPFPRLLNLVPRQTADSCRAELEFYKVAGRECDKLFSIKGRWSTTFELPYLSASDAIQKLLTPDPVTISAGSEGEPLDVFVWLEKDRTAYAWNNEAYIQNWRPEGRQLSKGSYQVRANITTQNGKIFSRRFSIEIGGSIAKTCLVPIKGDSRVSRLLESFAESLVTNGI